jgi:signal transduction histidine kinase
MEPKEGGRLNIVSGKGLDDGRIFIQINDTGIGIPTESIPKLFEPFFTTKRRKGVGLGLSVAYGIVQEHGGSIGVQSTAGEGSTFTIKLPLRPIDEKVA